MDGSYNQPYGHGHGPSHLNSPQTPSSATYQTNVNRSKTRKWVEARQQNYDGDDWGTDDFDQEPDSPPSHQQPPAIPSSRLASYGQRTPPAAAASDAGNPPALYIPTQHTAPPTQLAHYPAQPVTDAQPQDLSTVAATSQTKSSEPLVTPQDPKTFGSPDAPPQLTPALGFPAAQPAVPSYAEHTDHFGQVERKNTIRKPVGSAKPSDSSDAPPVPPKPEQPSNATQPGNTTIGPTSQDGEESILASAEQIERHRMSTSPQLPDVARMSTFGLDLFSGHTIRDSVMAAPPPQLVTEADQEPSAPGPLVDASASRVKTPSVKQDNTPSPQLATASPASATAEQVPVDDTTEGSEQVRKSTDGTPAAIANPSSEEPSLSSERVMKEEPAPSRIPNKSQEHDISPVSELDPEATPAAVQKTERTLRDSTKPVELQPVVDEPTIAPLRTSPSPRVSQLNPAATSTSLQTRVEPEPLETSVSAVAHMEQLDSRVPEYSPSDYDPTSLHREATFSTVASSPLKESDLLRDEIIKSLSPQNESTPVKFPPPDSQNFAVEPSKTAPRESTYTLSGYDTYWAEEDRGAQPAVSEKPEESKGGDSDTREQPAATTPRPMAAIPAVAEASPTATPVEPDARRRFSWEMGGEETVPGPAPGPAPAQEEAKTLKPVNQAQSPSTNINPVINSPKIEEPQTTATASSEVSHQVSKASSSRTPAGQGPEPPSPISDPSVKNQGPIVEDRRPSLAEQKSLARSEATPVNPSPPAGEHPALAASPTASRMIAPPQPPLMTFREIMALSSAKERIAKYDEARTRFAAVESGLSDWLANLQSSHPDHANATAMFGTSVKAPGAVPTSLPSTAGGQMPTQQPYYQQYLNASSPTTANPPGRSRLGGLSTSGQSHSAFGHSSDKIGIKSKEFMQSAGKMGKGLFSKGKSKLRGTGDKQADASPSTTPVQGKTRSDRRSSWALSLGNRPRAEATGLHSNADRVGQPPPLGHSPQQSNIADTFPLTNARPDTGQTLPKQAHGNGLGSGPSVSKSQHVSGEPRPPNANFGGHPEHSRAVGVSLPLDGDADKSTWDPFDGSPYAREKSPNVGDLTSGETKDADVRVSGDWVVVPRDNTAPRDTQPPRTAPEDSGIGMSSPADNRPIGLKRDPSFGLPMIKRSTTLDFGFRDAFGSENNSRTTSNQHPGAEGLNASHPSSTDEVAAPENLNTVLGEQKSMQEDSGHLTPAANQSQSAPTMSDQGSNRTVAQANLPLLQTQSPVQKPVTPPGQWIVQESHLSEPLHQVSRKRSGTLDSQQFTYGLDKEMGFTSSSPISPPSAYPRQRPGNQLPPSSAQRYPELFTNAQPQTGPRGRSNSGSNMMGTGFPQTQSNKFEIPGVGPPEDRGRRKSTSIFKEFGNRIARASSRDRRPSVSDSRPTTSEIMRPDDLSENGAWADNNAERRRKRSSLLFGLRSRPSMEMTTQVTDLRPEDGPTVIQPQALGANVGASASQNALPLTSEEERRPKSIFGIDKLKLRPARTERWDSDVHDDNENSAQKSRLSGLGGKVAGLAGALRRPTSQQSQDHDRASLAASNFNEEARQASQQHQQLAKATPPPGASQGARGRPGSASGLISGLLGRPSSRTREQQQGLPIGQQASEDSRAGQMYAGRASMDQRPSAPSSVAQQTPPQPSIRPVSQSPPPAMSGMDGGVSADAGRFETVSPELSVRSVGHKASSRGDDDQQPVSHSQQPSMASGQSAYVPPPAGVSPPIGGYYGPRQPPYGQAHMHTQPMLQQVPIQPAFQQQGSFGPPDHQSAQFMHQQSGRRDISHTSVSRQSSISLRSSNQDRPGAPEGQQSSRWRGLKNRISTQLTPQTADKTGGKDDRLSGTKLLGAFKRNSKQQPSPPVSMPQHAGGHGQQWMQPPQPHPRGMPQPGPYSHPRHMMSHGPPSMQQGIMAPPPQQQQQHFIQPQGHPQHPVMGLSPNNSYQYQRQPSAIGQPQQPLPHGFAPGIQSHSPPQMHVPPGHQTQQQKQYEQVPIPAPYGATSDHGNALSMDRQMRNYTTSFQYNMLGQTPPPNQWQQGPRQHGIHAPPNGSTTLPNSPPAPVGPGPMPQGYDTRSFNDAPGIPPAPSQSVTDRPQVGRISLQKSPPPLASPTAMMSMIPPRPNAEARPDYPREDSEVPPSSQKGSINREPSAPQSEAEKQLAPAPSTASTPIAQGESKNTANLSVDVAKAEADKEDDLYDATPRLVQGKMEEKSPEATAHSTTPAAKESPVVSPAADKKDAKGDPSFAMELEDTEEARKRTIRLNSQEEKIFYDPADDDDNPTMNATSYPGQEWNPYGEFEYSDLGEEPHTESAKGR